MWLFSFGHYGSGEARWGGGGGACSGQREKRVHKYERVFQNVFGVIFYFSFLFFLSFTMRSSG